MNIKVLLLSLLTLVQESYSHYTFPSLIVNGTVTPQWKYVRNIGYDPAYGLDAGQSWPLYDVYSSDMICNREASAGTKTATATVIAGDEVGFRVSPYLGITTTISHPGPGQAYMSKAPNDDVDNYDGKGDWFKIAYVGPTSNSSWALLGEKDIKFKVPKTTPPGKYLLRVEHLFVHDRVNETQIYVSCAHVSIVGPGGGRPTNFTRFPGGYSATDPGKLNNNSSGEVRPLKRHLGILVTSAQAGSYDLLKYRPPGPAVWQG